MRARSMLRRDPVEYWAWIWVSVISALSVRAAVADRGGRLLVAAVALRGWAARLLEGT
jgi:hypothetical protein